MFIEIKGKQLGIKFSNYGIEQIPTIKNPGNSLYVNMTAMVWCGYLAWCVWKQVDPDPEIEFGDFSDWVDQSINNEEIAAQVKKVFELYQENPIAQRVKKKELQNGQLEEKLA